MQNLPNGRKGIFLSAISAIDVALWNIKGKLLNQPVSVLLGGRKREKIKAYATGMYFSECDNLDRKLAEEAHSHKSRGFQAMKMKLDLV